MNNCNFCCGDLEKKVIVIWKFRSKMLFHHNRQLGNKMLIHYNWCRNPSFGFVTKARACKGVGQKGSPGV